jgi:hypothetical protein
VLSLLHVPAPFDYIKSEIKKKGVKIMKRYSGNQVVKKGIYLSLKRRDFVTIESESDLLPGASDERYVKIPPVAMIVLGPIMGLMYVIFLPFISFAMVLGVMAHKAFLGLRFVGRSLVRETTLHWIPGVAYLIWRGRSEKGKRRQFEECPREEKKPEAPDRLSELEKEIAKKREEDERA